MQAEGVHGAPFREIFFCSNLHALLLHLWEKLATIFVEEFFVFVVRATIADELDSPFSIATDINIGGDLFLRATAQRGANVRFRAL